MEDVDLTITGRVFFKKYKVSKKLGEGSFGQVFKGINITTNEDIAFKLVINNIRFSLFLLKKYLYKLKMK